MYFYELYLKDTDNSLIDVPVALKYMRDSNPFLTPILTLFLVFNEQVNKDISQDITEFKYVRRFFLVDGLTGIDDGEAYNDINATKMIRFPSKMILKFKIMNNNLQKIYKPILIVEYAEASLTLTDDDYLVDIEFQVYFLLL
jgi:hypothetical protein